MSILCIKDDTSVYPIYINTILKENINSVNIEKNTSVILKVFYDTNIITRTVISNPWGKEDLTITVMFDVFVSRLDSEDEGVLGVKLLINNKTITIFKITTSYLNFTKDEIVREVKLTLQDIFS